MDLSFQLCWFMLCKKFGQIRCFMFDTRLSGRFRFIFCVAVCQVPNQVENEISTVVNPLELYGSH